MISRARSISSARVDATSTRNRELIGLIHALNNALDMRAPLLFVLRRRCLPACQPSLTARLPCLTNLPRARENDTTYVTSRCASARILQRVVLINHSEQSCLSRRVSCLGEQSRVVGRGITERDGSRNAFYVRNQPSTRVFKSSRCCANEGFVSSQRKLRQLSARKRIISGRTDNVEIGGNPDSCRMHLR